MLAVLAFVAAVIGVRQGWLSFAWATRGVVAFVVPSLAVLAVVLGVVALVAGLIAKPRVGAVGALVAVALGLLIFLIWTVSNAESAKTPPVHDVATDWTDPLTFSQKTMDARGERANPVELAPAVPEGPSAGGFLGRPVAEVNARTCASAVPAVVLFKPAEAYAQLKAGLVREHMAILVDDPASGRIEATAARGLWGVRDDVVGRVRPEGAGSRVDFRGVARQGLNDGGANCARIGRLRHAVGIDNS